MISVKKTILLVLVLLIFFPAEVFSVGIVRRRGNRLPPISKDFQGMQAEACRADLKGSPENPRLHACVALDAMKRKNWEEAVQHWEKSIQMLGGVGNTSHTINLATSYLHLGKPDRARERVVQALQFNPSSITLHAWLASFWESKNDREKTEAAYKKILPLRPAIEYPLEYYYFAQAILEVGDEQQFPEAEQALKTFLAMNAKHYPAWTFLGYVLLRMAKPDEAIEALRAGEVIKADHLPIQLLLAQAYLSTGKPDRTIFHGGEVLKRLPDHLTANYLIGTAYLRKGNKERGIEYLNRAVLPGGGPEGGMQGASLLLGRTYLSEGRIAEARNVLEELARQSPEDYAIQIAFIRLLIQSGDTEKAFEAANRVLKNDPENQMILTLKSAALSSLGEVGAAETLLKSILHEDQDFLPAQVEQIRLYQKQEKLDLAFHAAEQVIKERPTHPVGYEMKGNIALTQHDLLTAIAAFQKVVQIKPDHLMSWKKIFTLQFQSKDISGAEESAEQMIQQFSRLPAGYFSKGLVLLHQKKEREAGFLFQKVIDLDGNYFKAHNYLARIASKEQPEEAIRHYEASLQALPRQPMIYARLANLYLRNEKKNEGFQLARAFVAQYPGQGGPHFLMGRLYIGDGQKEEGILHLKKAIALAPKTPAFYLNLGSIYEKEGARNKAIDLYKSALRSISDHPVFLNNLAWNYTELDRIKEALPLAEKAEKLRPQDWTIKDTVGWIYYKEGNYEAAIEKLKEAIAINDQHPTLQYHIALAYLATDRAEIALNHLRKSVRTPGPFPEKEAVRRLISSMKK